MTIRYSEKKILDKILHLFGKERKNRLSGAEESYKKYGPYTSFKARKESFLKTLFSGLIRSKTKEK